MTVSQTGVRERSSALIVEAQTIFTPHLAYVATLAGALDLRIVGHIDEVGACDEFRLILLDPDYVDSDPVESVSRLAATAPRSAICVLTGEHEPGRTMRLHRAGATAVVSKNANDQEFVLALQMSLDHKQYTDFRVDAA